MVSYLELGLDAPASLYVVPSFAILPNKWLLLRLFSVYRFIIIIICIYKYIYVYIIIITLEESHIKRASTQAVERSGLEQRRYLTQYITLRPPSGTPRQLSIRLLTTPLPLNNTSLGEDAHPTTTQRSATVSYFSQQQAAT